MHSCDPLPAPPPTGPALLQQLGRLIIRARSRSPSSPTDHRELLKAKLKLHQPSTSQQVTSHTKTEDRPAVNTQLDSHVNVLWTEQIPMCVEVLLAPDCQECYSKLSKIEEEPLFEKQMSQERRGLLLERWTVSVMKKKTHDSPSLMSPQWLVSAVRSQLHFSQLSAWLATLSKPSTQGEETDPQERRRKLSHEKCNFKKLESNCDEEDLPKQSPTNTEEKAKAANQRKLNVIYSIKIPGESYKMSEFVRQPVNHTFPITDIGNNIYLKVVQESLPRLKDIPKITCFCPKENHPHRETTKNIQDEITSKMNDLTLGPPDEFRYKRSHNITGLINSNIGCNSSRINNEYLTEHHSHVASCNKEKNILDDRMHTNCRESGKHKCSCDDESDPGKEKSSTSFSTPKKLDEKRLKEIAKYKRRLRKENKLKKLRDANSSESTGTSEGEGMHQKKLETHTSIPILQASRFDIFRAIGFYRNQTYCTLPATRFEGKTPFTNESYELPYKKTYSTVGTQTDDLICDCGNTFENKRPLVRSEANLNLNSIIDIKCDSNVNNILIENLNKNIRKYPDDDLGSNIVKRPKLKRFSPIIDRLEQIAQDRLKCESSDIKELNLNDDDTVFDLQKKESQKREKHSSINEDYVLFETNDYGTIDQIEDNSDPSPISNKVFEFPEPIKPVPDAQIPSPTEMDRFRYRFDSAASMVFHSKTGLPLTSSPAPLKRGNNCFDYDDSINGISGIKSALFHPVSEPPTPTPTPVSPRPVPPKPRVPTAITVNSRVKLGPSAGLLGTFEESALKGRLEPVATVHGFTAELGASGAFCPPHRRLPVTVFFYAPGGTNAPYMGHINLGSTGYRVSPSGTIQVSLFNPHGTLVKMFVVLYDLRGMPPATRTFLRQRTLYLPAGTAHPPMYQIHKFMRYLIHLRFMTSKSGKLYLHTDIRIIVSRKADMDTATAHSAVFKSAPTNHKPPNPDETPQEPISNKDVTKTTNQKPCRVFGGSPEFRDWDLGYENQNGVAYELRSFTYGPENPKFSPR